MRSSSPRKQNDGFTLVEVIVVLVILAILAATLIPSLAGYIDRANDRSAIAECRSCVMAAQTLASERYAANQTLTLDDSAAVVALADLPNSCEIRLLHAPAGKVAKLILKSSVGIFVTYENGVYTIGNLSSFADAETMNVLAAVFAENRPNGSYHTDSGAQDIAGSEAAKVKAALAAEGIDLARLDAVSWQYRQADNEFYWTCFDLKKLPAVIDRYGAKVPVMKYDFATNTYSVWTSQVRKGGYGGNQYSVLERSRSVPGYTDVSYDEAFAEYDRMTKEYRQYPELL